MQHGLQCLARLVRLFLGPDAMAVAKMACGPALSILGVDVELSERGFRCSPTRDKVARWSADMRRCLAECRLLPGEASKLAGRLSWACSHLFKRFGRATLRAVFDQKTRRDGSMAPELRRALLWWCEVRSVPARAGGEFCVRMVAWLGIELKAC